MKKHMLLREFWMEIKKSKNRFLSVLSIVFLGVAFFAGVRASGPDMRLSADIYYDRQKLMDIRVVGTLGMTEADISALEKIEGVQRVQPSYSVDVLLHRKEEQQLVKLMSVTEGMNKILISEGKLPESENEILLDQMLRDKFGYQLGDKIKVDIPELKQKLLTVCGFGSSPFYLSLERGTSKIGNGKVDGFGVLSQKSFAMEAYSELYVKTKDTEALLCYSEEYEDGVSQVTDAIKDLANERCRIRYEELQQEGQKAIAEAEQEISEAERQLSDAGDQLADAETQLADARTELEDYQLKLDEGKEELEKNRQILADSEAQLADGWRQWENGNELYAAAVEEYQALEDAYPAQDSMIADKEEHYWQLVAAYEELVAEQKLLEEQEKQLDEGRQALNEAEQEWQQGCQELQDAKKILGDKEKEFADAERNYLSERQSADKKLADAYRDLEDGKKELSEMERPDWYVLDRNSIQTYVEFEQDAQRIEAIGRVFPVIFFLVAALICLTTITRMVEEERMQIGTLKALGYHKIVIMLKYISYALLATVLGSLGGLVIGQKLLPAVIINAYGILYDTLPTIVTPLHAGYSVSSSLLALLCTTMAAVGACYKELLAVPAALMRPEAPRAGKRILLERITLLWQRLSFSQKSTMRNLFRYKKRFLMTVFGIGGCMGLLLVGFGLKDSIMAIGDKQFGNIRIFSGMLILDEELEDEEAERILVQARSDVRLKKTMEASEHSVDVGSTNGERASYLVVVQEPDQLEDFICLQERTSGRSIPLKDEGVVITEKLAKLLQVTEGDTIYLKDGDTKRLEIPVTGVAENYFYHYVYITEQCYERLYQKEAPGRELFFILDEEQSESDIRSDYMAIEGVSSVTFLSDMRNRVADMLKSMDIIIYVIVIAAGLLNFLVLYNLNNINISERKRELATLKVLGFYEKEVSAYVFRENIWLTLFGCLIGFLFGRILHQYVILTAEIDMMMFGRELRLHSYCYSIILTWVFSFFVNLVMHFRLKAIDMVESLKSIE